MSFPPISPHSFPSHSAESDMGGYVFGHYEGYETWPFQAIGMLIVVLVSTVFIFGVIKPELYDPLASSVERHLSIIRPINKFQPMEEGSSYIEIPER